MKKALATGLLAALMVCGIAKAEDAPKISFDAVYLQTSPAGQNHIRILSNGQGKVRTENDARGTKNILIQDYVNRVYFQLLDAQRIAMRYAFRTSNIVRDTASAKAMNAKFVGQQVIYGHPAHGYEYMGPNGKTTVWIGVDIDYMVKQQTVTPQGTSIALDLQTFTQAQLPESLFQIPPGYKLMNMQGGGIPVPGVR